MLRGRSNNELLCFSTSPSILYRTNETIESKQRTRTVPPPSSLAVLLSRLLLHLPPSLTPTKMLPFLLLPFLLSSVSASNVTCAKTSPQTEWYYNSQGLNPCSSALLSFPPLLEREADPFGGLERFRPAIRRFVSDLRTQVQDVQYPGRRV